MFKRKILKSLPTSLKREEKINSSPPLGGVRGDLKKALKIFFKAILKTPPNLP